MLYFFAPRTVYHRFLIVPSMECAFTVPASLLAFLFLPVFTRGRHPSVSCSTVISSLKSYTGHFFCCNKVHIVRKINM